MDQSASPVPPPAPSFGQTRCKAVALLVDGENIAPTLAGRAIMAARRLGPVSILRVYGNAATLGDWLAAPGFRAIHAHAGKNVTDMLLTVEAMELSYAGLVDGFALASSDRDFAPLAQSLKARGFPVLGLTGPASPAMFSNSCTETACLVAPPHPATPPPAATGDPRAAARALLQAGPRSPQDFARAMSLAGHRIPAGSRTWRAYLTKTFATLTIHGQGQDARLSLAEPR